MPDENLPPRPEPPMVPPPLTEPPPPPVILQPAGGPAPTAPTGHSSGSRTPRSLVRQLLSLYLLLFTASACVAFADDSLSVLFRFPLLAIPSGLLFLLNALASAAIYLLMALAPMIPKRLFVPACLYSLFVFLVLVPCCIYAYQFSGLASWALSALQTGFASYLLYSARGEWRIGWPLVSESVLGRSSFTWQNLLVFVGSNVLVLLPLVCTYLFLCASLAVSHFTEGFLTLHPAGFTVEMRKYTRSDGKTIELYPMAHIGDAEFYHRLDTTFPSNSVVLMEGVSDSHNLLTNRISYQRMARTLGLTEQVKEFKPQGHIVRADVDVSEFSANTLGFLNLVMLIHAHGLKPDLLVKLLENSPSPEAQAEIWDDLLAKRNAHLLGEIDSELKGSELLVVPWGVAHMPGISKAIQKEGFRLKETQELKVIRFGW